MKASIAFLDAYVRSLDPPDRDLPGELPDSEQRRLGRIARIAPQGTLPLVVAWQATAADLAPVQISSPVGFLTTP